MAQKSISGTLKLAEKIRARRNELHLTIEEAAKRAGLGTKTWCHYKILGKANKITVVNDHYFSACMLVRNRYMVDHSDTVLAIWNGEESGGTWQTIMYARSQNKKIDIIHIDKI